MNTSVAWDEAKIAISSQKQQERQIVILEIRSITAPNVSIAATA